MLMPKRVKYRRVHRGRMTGKAMRGNTLAYGEYGSGPIGSNQALFFDVTLKKVDRAK